MSRAATTSDSFNAVAEPRRRDILDFLAPAERPVGDIVVALGLAQPSVSKHRPSHHGAARRPTGGTSRGRASKFVPTITREGVRA
jgi:DNA-binding transcriptional ArsR family regulator